MFAALFEIMRDRWVWRKQVLRLGKFGVISQKRGTVFSLVWLLAKPIVHIFCFWVALGVGLRAGGATDTGSPPYILWLCAGIIPWFFMSAMLGPGADIFHKYRYLVNRISFPLPCITTMFAFSTMWVQLMLSILLLLVYFVCGMPLDLTLIQVPILLGLMLLFWDFASMLLSILSAISRDIRQMILAISTPLFWLSGVIFPVDNLPFGLSRLLKAINPITFFVTGFRDALYYKVWCFIDTPVTIGFVSVFVSTALLCSWAYERYGKELRDVL